MPKTKIEVVQRALRRLAVISDTETASADQMAYCGDALDGLLAETQAVSGETFTWTVDETPDAAAPGLSLWLAAEVADHYMVAPPRGGKLRFYAYAFPNTTTDRRDADEDGTISDAEAQAGLEAAFY